MTEDLSQDLAQQESCLIGKRAICPFFFYPHLSLFWKASLVTMAILMLVFALTLWGLANYLSQHTAKAEAQRVEMVAALRDIKETILSHKQLTLENRVIQARIEGYLSGMVEKPTRKPPKKNLSP